ncbi:DNA-binding response regulator [Halomicronema hongdechloris C2206]|uniref:DNA-binding response regulator n=1 Tax=Halomicronema hongdechloris C2206 TaxID=1641165 RepID=A0A1Z3HKJ7_9CYAN|nr:AraC family transcriptional regulator [Halomicronema hongdechloris]ASC70617.1 DNA-binding response regulator [Halomicronema hongdechloris C2206]
MSQASLSSSEWSAQAEWHVTRQWGPLAIRHVRHVCRDETGADAWSYPHEHTLGLFLSPRPFKFSHRQEGRTQAGLYSKGDLLVTPADTTLATQAEGDVHMVQLRIQDSFVRHVAGETLEQNCDRIELVPTLQTRDPHIDAIATMLLSELQRESFGSQLYVESLANVLAVHLLRHHTTTRAPLPVYAGGLPQRQLLQVSDYIDAHLGSAITLAELAELVDISQFHFGRLFKRSLGLSPYQYLLQQRVERAKTLLKRTDKPIVAIALECGFNSHSHLGRKFRQLTGMTPKAYRTQ